VLFGGKKVPGFEGMTSYVEVAGQARHDNRLVVAGIVFTLPEAYPMRKEYGISRNKNSSITLPT
jgi:hypothetical protein